MNKTLLNIKLLYEKMGSAEKKIADTLLSAPSMLIPLSISDFAESCGCGDATVVRFARRLGFSGYQELKISLAKETNISAKMENISKNDTPATVFAKVCDDIYCSLEKTKASLNEQSLLDLCNAILSAKQVLIFGLGNSASVASDMAHKLLRLGLNVFAYTDNHMQAIASAHSDKTVLVIGISHSGSSKDIVEALRLAKQNNATTVAITNYGKSPIEKTSDIVIKTIADETNYSILGLSSRITQLAIIDAIYSYLLCQLPSGKAESEKTESALLNKKY